MSTEPIVIVALLAANVVVAEWLARHTPLRHLGSALLVIVTTAVCANVGLMPTYGGTPVYDAVFGPVARMGIFWLLLGVRIGDLRKAGGPMVVMFLIGSAGTMLGVLAGIAAAGGAEAFGEHFAALGGMFVGTYTGGSVNFQAVALHYRVVEDAVLFGGANLVDSAMTTIWMAACVVLPRVLRPRWPSRGSSWPVPRATTEIDTTRLDEETADPTDVGIAITLGGAAVWFSDWGATWTLATLGIEIPSMIVLTTVAIVLAQLSPIQRLRGTRVLGMFAVMVFLAVIGALCDVEKLAESGRIGVSLCIFVATAVAVHGMFTFGLARLLRLDVDVAAVASQANIGGGTTALALARGLGRPDLVLPAILVGSLGTGLGTYLGFFTARLLS